MSPGHFLFGVRSGWIRPKRFRSVAIRRRTIPLRDLQSGVVTALTDSVLADAVANAALTSMRLHHAQTGSDRLRHFSDSIAGWLYEEFHGQE